MLRKHKALLAYVLVLTVFTAYVMLDTLVITRVYGKASDAEMQTEQSGGEHLIKNGGKKKSKKLNSNNKNVINQGRKCDFLWQFSFFSCIIRKKVVPLQRFLCHVVCVSSQKAIEPSWEIQ